MANKWVKRGLGLLALLLVAAIAYDLLQKAAPPARPRADFTATTLTGEKWSLAEHRGKSPVLVNFFATWCGPCQYEIPELMKLQQEYADQGLKVVLLTRESAEEVKADANIAALPVPILVNADEAFDAYGVDGIPHTVFFGADGAVVADIEGYSPKALDEVKEHLRKSTARERNEPSGLRPVSGRA